jgi:hypothetical protein
MARVRQFTPTLHEIRGKASYVKVCFVENALPGSNKSIHKKEVYDNIIHFFLGLGKPARRKLKSLLLSVPPRRVLKTGKTYIDARKP